MNILGFVEINNWILLFLFIVISLYLYSKWKLSLWKRLGVPGPPPTLFLGHGGLYNKVGMHKVEQEMVAKYGNIVGLYIGHFPTVLIADPELIRDILIKDFSRNPNRPDPFKSNNELQHGLDRLRNDHWRFMRNTISPTFSSGKMRRMEQTLHKKCQSLLNVIQMNVIASQPLNCKELFGNFTMDTIAALGFGMDIDAQINPNSEFVKNAKVLFTAADSKWLAFLAIFPSFARVVDFLGLLPINNREILGFFKTAVHKAIAMRDDTDKDNQDFLQLMLNAHKDTDENDDDNVNVYQNNPEKWKKRGLTADEIMGNALLFLLAGYHTTASSLTFMSYCLATNPDCQDKLIEEVDTVIGKEPPTYDKIQKMEYLDCIFNETLRLYPPAVRTSRVADKDFDLAGYRIPKDTELAFPIFAMHRSSKYWHDPHKFDPERFKIENKSIRNPYAFLPFGLGPRQCIAMRLAQMEAKCAIISMLQRYRIVPCEETEIPLVLGISNVLLKPENDVKLTVEPRKLLL